LSVSLTAFQQGNLLVVGFDPPVERFVGRHERSGKMAGCGHVQAILKRVVSSGGVEEGRTIKPDPSDDGAGARECGDRISHEE
jgi:hypothetical protein